MTPHPSALAVYVRELSLTAQSKAIQLACPPASSPRIPDQNPTLSPKHNRLAPRPGLVRPKHLVNFHLQAKLRLPV